MPAPPGCFPENVVSLSLHMGDAPSGLAPVREALAQTAIPVKIFHPTHVNRKRELLEEAFAFARQGASSI